MDNLLDPDVDIHFNLNRIENPWSSIQKVAGGCGTATDWEIFQIKQMPEIWDRVIWYRNGQIVTNPFE